MTNPWTSVCLWLLLPLAVQARNWPAPPLGIDLFGQEQVVTATYQETLLDIARRYSIGQEEIIRANLDLDRWLPGEGTRVLVPSRFILPNAPREGIVVNLPEMRLYHFSEDGRRIDSYPVSVGRMDWNTPLGQTRIVRKDKDPNWYPPESIKREHAARGEPLPDMVPAGPDNPLGHRALRLGLPAYLIHGTNNPWGVGMRVTHGCIRLYPEDIEQLFADVAVGTAVTLVDQPVKAARVGAQLFVEIHPPLEEQNLQGEALMQHAQNHITEVTGLLPQQYDRQALWRAVVLQTGVPTQLELYADISADFNPGV